jgi:hypothetical protein
VSESKKDVGNFTFFEQCIVIYICNKNQKNAHFLRYCLNLIIVSSPLTNRDRKQLNIFERKVYRRILGPVYDKWKRKLEDINP